MCTKSSLWVFLLKKLMSHKHTFLCLASTTITAAVGKFLHIPYIFCINEQLWFKTVYWTFHLKKEASECDNLSFKLYSMSCLLQKVIFLLDLWNYSTTGQTSFSVPPKVGLNRAKSVRQGSSSAWDKAMLCQWHYIHLISKVRKLYLYFRSWSKKAILLKKDSDILQELHWCRAY